MEKIYKILFFVVSISLLLTFFISERRETELKEKIVQLEQNTNIYRDKIQQLTAESDSLEIEINNIKIKTIEQIKTEFITKYEKEYKHISNFNANQHFEYFSKWLSEIN